jgi:predicted transport protein
MERAASVSAMLENLKEKTGRSLDEWKNLIASKNFSKHGEILKFLKETHNVTHGYASEIALKVLGSDAASTTDTDVLIVNQYKGKEHLKAFYDKLIVEIQKFNGEFEIAPKKTYVSLRRKKQFIVLNPASKTRFEIGFNLKGVAATGKLQAEKPDGICSHKISLSDITEIDAEVIDWIRMAFNNAG